MTRYRTSNRLPVQRVHIKVNKPVAQRPPLSFPRSAPKVHQPQQIVKKSPARPANKPRPNTQWKRRQSLPRPPQPRVVKSYVKPSRSENRQSAAARRHNSLLSQYRDAVEKLRGIGRGKALVMVACGPSIAEAPLEKLNGKHYIDIMCINKPEPRVWPSTYWAFCDQSQFSRNRDHWSSYNGVIINASSVRARRERQVLIRSLSGTGFSKDLIKGYHIGRSSTYANLQAAVWMGYDKIYIFGLDMCAVDGKLHFYGKNPDVSDDNRIKRFSREAESYNCAVRTLNADERKRIVLRSSYNKYKFTESFPRLHQADAVNIILEEFGKKG